MTHLVFCVTLFVLMIRDNLKHVEDSIAAICRRLGRKFEDIVLIGVTKYAEPANIREGVEAGLRHIGENKVQEAQRKFPVLDELGVKVTRHMIGHLQTNKAKLALEFFDLIQSVDSLKLAQEITKHAGKSGKNADILIQVNTAGEEQKFGTAKNQAVSLVEEVSKLPGVRIQGLMAIAPLTDDKNIVRECFRGLRTLSEDFSKKYAGSKNVEMKYLSMGMTDDYEIALEEGSNMLRIGRAIFAA